MGKALDLTDQRFGRLLVNEFAGTIGEDRQSRKRFWYATCDCGTETLVSTQDLRSGKTKSCGCLSAELSRERKLVHGGCLNRRDQGESPEFQAWHNMKNRDEYIPSWNDFRQFIRDVGWRPDDTYELGRHDIRQPHGPDNSYWRNTNEERIERKSNGNNELCINMLDLCCGLDTKSNPPVETRERQTAGVY